MEGFRHGSHSGRILLQCHRNVARDGGRSYSARAQHSACHGFRRRRQVSLRPATVLTTQRYLRFHLPPGNLFHPWRFDHDPCQPYWTAHPGDLLGSDWNSRCRFRPVLPGWVSYYYPPAARANCSPCDRSVVWSRLLASVFAMRLGVSEANF